MNTFSVKSASVKEEISKPHFFVLCKGLNSGKPISEKCPNSFIIQAESKEFKEILYWISFSLWRTKAFHPFLRGSVIPYYLYWRLQAIDRRKNRSGKSKSHKVCRNHQAIKLYRNKRKATQRKSKTNTGAKKSLCLQLFL